MRKNTTARDNGISVRAPVRFVSFRLEHAKERALDANNEVKDVRG